MSFVGDNLFIFCFRRAFLKFMNKFYTHRHIEPFGHLQHYANYGARGPDSGVGKSDFTVRLQHFKLVF